MRGGTGEKIRALKAQNIDLNERFEFNRSIIPSGGLKSRVRIRTLESGRKVIKIFQDINNDGKATRKELIYHGKSRVPFVDDEITDFQATIRLQKRMHMCDWLSMKFPGEDLICTEEYIPVTYKFSLIFQDGSRYRFEGIGEFMDDSLFANNGSVLRLDSDYF